MPDDWAETVRKAFEGGAREIAPIAPLEEDGAWAQQVRQAFGRTTAQPTEGGFWAGTKKVVGGIGYALSPLDILRQTVRAPGAFVGSFMGGKYEKTPGELDYEARLQKRGLPIPPAPEVSGPMGGRDIAGLLASWGTLGYGKGFGELARMARRSAGEDIRELDIGQGWSATLAGLAVDIAGDPLNLLFPFGLTKAGVVAKKTGKLASTWAKQVQLGQRAALTIALPGVRGGAGAMKAARVVAIRGPRAVRGMAKFGQALATKLPVTRTAYRLFATKSAIPDIRAGQQLAAKRKAFTHLELLRFEDRWDDLTKGLSDELKHMVPRAAEHVGRHADELAKYPEVVRKLAPQWLALNAEARAVSAAAGLAQPSFGSGLRRSIQTFGKMRGREAKRMLKSMNVKLGTLSAREQNHIKHMIKVSDMAWKAQDEAVGLADELWDLFLMEEKYKALGIEDIAARSRQLTDRRVLLRKEAVKAQKAYEAAEKVFANVNDPRLASFSSTDDLMRTVDPEGFERFLQLEAQADAAERALLEATREANVTAVVLGRARKEKVVSVFDDLAVEIGARKAAAEKAVTQASRNAKRLFAQQARYGVLAQGAADQMTTLSKQGMAPTKEFTRLDDLLKQFSEAEGRMPNWVPHILTDKARRLVVKQGGRVKNLEARLWTDQWNGFLERKMAERLYTSPKAPPVLRPRSIDEIVKEFAKAPVGGRLERYAEGLADRGGILGIIEKHILRRQPARDIAEKFYELDPARLMERVHLQIVKASHGRAFMDAMAPLASKTAQKGWFHAKELGAHMHDFFGDVWFSPDITRELRRTFTRMASPDAANAVMRGWDYVTRKFKWLVTQPFPAYHARNHYSDLGLMAYNGPFNPIAVHIDGSLTVLGRGKIKVGGALGTLDAAEVRRMCIATGVFFGESGQIGGIRFLENSRRAGYFVDRLKRGFGMFEAALDTKRVMFDFSELSTFERTVLRRAIPFYSWLRNNVKLHVTEMLRHPGTIMTQERIRGALRISPRGVAAMEAVPEWVRGRGYIPLGRDPMTNEEKLLTGLGTAYEDMAELLNFEGGFKHWVRQQVWRANPMLKIGATVPTMLAGRPYDFERLEPMNWPKATTDMVRHLPESAKKMMGVHKRTSRWGQSYYVIHPYWDWFFRNTLVRGYTSFKSLSRPDRPAWEGLLRYGTGFGITRYRPEEQVGRERRRKAQAKAEALQRRGDIGMGQYLYRPRGSRISPSEVRQLERGRRGEIEIAP